MKILRLDDLIIVNMVGHSPSYKNENKKSESMNNKYMNNKNGNFNQVYNNNNKCDFYD